MSKIFNPLTPPFDNVGTALGDNVITVNPYGGADYTTIQGALDDNPIEYITILCAPGTYTNDTINFTANNQSVKALGNCPTQTTITQTDATVVDFGTYTNCRVIEFTLKITAATAQRYLITGSNSGGYSGKLYRCLGVCTNSSSPAYSPVCIGHAAAISSLGTIEVIRGKYILNDNQNITFKKIVEPVSNCSIAMIDTILELNSTGTASVVMGVAGFGGPLDMKGCSVEINQTGAGFISAAVYASLNVSNDVVLKNNTFICNASTTDSYGYYANVLGGTVNVTSSYNLYKAANGLGTSRGGYLNQSGGGVLNFTSNYDSFLGVDDNYFNCNLSMVGVDLAGNFRIDGNLTNGSETLTILNAKDAYDHSQGDGSDHADVAANTVHSTSNGSDHADVVLNTTHRTSDGSDHAFIDQSVVSGASPTFSCTNFTQSSLTERGCVELATSAETSTSNDATRAITPTGFYDSTRNIRWLRIPVYDQSVDVLEGSDLSDPYVMPFDGEFIQNDSYPYWCCANVATAGSGGTMEIDVFKNGTSIFDTMFLLETSETTTATSTTQPDLATSATFAAGDIITVDVDSEHSTTVAKGLHILLGLRQY
jgi:hypothetical protein